MSPTTLSATAPLAQPASAGARAHPSFASPAFENPARPQSAHARPITPLALSSLRSSRKPQRGEIWFVSRRSSAHAGSETAVTHQSIGTEMWSDRLAVVVSNDRMNSTGGFSQIVYLNVSPARIPNELHVAVAVPQSKHTAIAVCEQIHSVDHSRMLTRRGAVDASTLADIEKAVGWALGLSRPLPVAPELSDTSSTSSPQQLTAPKKEVTRHV